MACTAEIIGSKWTAIIVHDLSEGPRRFSELERACPGISPRTLSERLDMLEREGVVGRHSYPESPPRVEYELTAKGSALLPIIHAMSEFGHRWLVGDANHARNHAREKAPDAPEGDQRPEADARTADGDRATDRPRGRAQTRARDRVA